MEGTPHDFDLENTLTSMPYVAPHSVLGNPRLESLLREFLERLFQNFTPDDLFRYLPAWVQKNFASQQLASVSLNRPSPSVAPETFHSNGPGLVSTDVLQSHQTDLPTNNPPCVSRIIESNESLKSSTKRCRTDDTRSSASGNLTIPKKSRKKRRTNASAEIANRGKEYLIGRTALCELSISTIWDVTGRQSAVTNTPDVLDVSPTEDTVTQEVEKPLKICGTLWRRNKEKIQEAECFRRFLILFISHVVEHCESIPEIPQRKLCGHSKRTYALTIASREIGETPDVLKLMISFAHKYFTLAFGAGLSRLLEIHHGKSWFWEKSMTKADIDMACLDLRGKHKDMDEREKEQRSEIDFMTCQGFVRAIESWGISRKRLASMNTRLTDLLRKFMDFERLQYGELRPSGIRFYSSTDVVEDVQPCGAGHRRHTAQHTNDGPSREERIIQCPVDEETRRSSRAVPNEPQHSNPGHDENLMDLPLSQHPCELSLQREQSMIASEVVFQCRNKGAQKPSARPCDESVPSTSIYDATSVRDPQTNGIALQSESHEVCVESHGNRNAPQSCDSHLQSAPSICNTSEMRGGKSPLIPNTEATSQWLENLGAASDANITVDDVVMLPVDQNEEFAIISDWADAHGLWFNNTAMGTFEGW